MTAGVFNKGLAALYRPVCLIATEPVHIAIEDLGSQGIYITPHKKRTAKAPVNKGFLPFSIGVFAA